MIKVASISGGKDSTAMLIVLAMEDTPLDYVVFLNTGLEFPQTIRFIREKLDPWCREHFGLNITFIYPKKPFGYYFQKYGVPNAPNGRWCCRVLKKDPFYYWLKENVEDSDIILYLGYAYNEKERFERAKREAEKWWKRRSKNVIVKAPLIEAKIDEKGAKEICKKHKLLNPLYEHFDRTGCWLCPFQGKRDWFKLYKYYPQLWEAAKRIERKSIEMGKYAFRQEYTLEDLENKFRLIKTLVEIGLNGGE